MILRQIRTGLGGKRKNQDRSMARVRASGTRLIAQPSDSGAPPHALPGAHAGAAITMMGTAPRMTGRPSTLGQRPIASVDWRARALRACRRSQHKVLYPRPISAPSKGSPPRAVCCQNRSGMKAPAWANRQVQQCRQCGRTLNTSSCSSRPATASYLITSRQSPAAT